MDADYLAHRWAQETNFASKAISPEAAVSHNQMAEMFRARLHMLDVTERIENFVSEQKSDSAIR